MYGKTLTLKGKGCFMAFEISPLQSSVIKETIATSFEPVNIAETAISFGYDINAGFLPQEFEVFSKKVCEYVLERIKENQLGAQCYQADQESSLKGVAKPLIEAQLKSACKVVPQSQIFYPHPGPSLWTWLASIIWPSGSSQS